MAYDTATATSVADLLDKFRLFLIAAGWTVEGFVDRTAGNGKALAVVKSGLRWTWLSDTDDLGGGNPGPWLGVYQHTGYSGAADPDAQAGASPKSWANRMTGPMQAYHFMAGDGPSGPYAHLVVETDPGTFKHAGMGVLRKMGAVTNGAYSFASSWLYDGAHRVNNPDDSAHLVPFDDLSQGGGAPGTVLRADYGAISPRYHPVDWNDAARARGGWRTSGGEHGTIVGPATCGSSQLTGRAPLLPLWCAVDRGSGLWTDVGYPADLRFVRMDNLEPGMEYPLGTDTWLVFPVIRKNGAVGSPNSGVYGLAYRRVD